MKAHIKNLNDIKITACTIAKNEEKTIARSINSYKKYVDEIIVVDTGSDDNTVKIAKELGAKIINFKWCNDFAAAKNAGLDAASGDWIIYLDADEYFAGDTCRNVRTAITEAINQNKNAVGCRMENYDQDTGVNIADGFSVRIFEKGARYQYAVHEELFNPKGIYVLTVDKTIFYLRHSGYSSKIVAEKCRRNLDIMLKELEELTDDRRRITYYSYISDSYFGINDYKESIKYAKMYLKESEEKNIRILGCEIKPYMNIIQGMETMKEDPEKISAYVTEFLEKFQDCPEAHHEAGRNYRRLFMFNAALDEFKKALDMAENYSGVYIDTVSAKKAVVYNECGMCCEAMQNTVEAINYYFKAYKEDTDYQSALFNLIRVIRGMPDSEVDSFIKSLYAGVSPIKHLAVLSALMSHYMAPQIIECYAAYRTDKKDDPINADVTAFVMAGKGNFKSAAEMFLFNYKSAKNGNTLARCLICAALSNYGTIIDELRKECTDTQLFTFGFADKKSLGNRDLYDIALLLAECRNMGQADFAMQRLCAMEKQLSGKELLRLSYFLADAYFFEAALYAARNADLSAKAIFMQGYCLYNLHRYNEAADLLLLARHLRLDFSYIEDIYNRVAAVKENAQGNQPDDLSTLKSLITQEIESGDIKRAVIDIAKYKRIAEPDAEIFAAEALAMYYMGDYKAAAVAVQCGLLKDDKNLDLLYNAGCIYEKLGNKRQAASMYKKALKYCTDAGLTAEIEQMLKAL